MPKMKTHSGAKKRFKITATGLVKAKSACTRHRLISKAKTAKVRNRGTRVLFHTDGVNIKKSFMPNSF